MSRVNKILGRILVVGGFATLGASAIMKQKIENNIKSSEYFTTAVKKLEDSEAAASALGLPITLGTPDLGKSSQNHCDGLKAKFTVPIKGSKDSGTMSFEASRETYQQPWNITLLELTMKDESRKLVLCNQPPS